MRVVLLTVVLAVVLGVSALNLALGGLWVAALAVVALLRRRVRWAAALVFLLVLAAMGVAFRLDRLTPPPPGSYATDEVGWLAERLGLARSPEGAEPPDGGTVAETQDTTARARLEARRGEELRYTAPEIERRAVAAVALSRRAERLRARAPGEVAGLEEAVRRLALTLTSPEFRDLEGRRRRVQDWLASLETRLATARDETEVDGVVRALDPAAMAPVSLRAVREDLARVEAATTALVRAVAGSDVSMRATSAVEYDESQGQLVTENRYVLQVDPPLRIARLDVSVLRQAPEEGGAVQRLTYKGVGAGAREVEASGEIALGTGIGRVVVEDRRVRGVAPRPVRSPLRPIAFGRIVIDSRDSPAELSVTVTLEGVGGAEALLVRPTPLPEIERISVPRYALHHVSRAGVVTPVVNHDVWSLSKGEAAGSRPRRLAFELTPPSVLLRNRLVTGLRGYLYRPSLGGILGLAGLAALTALLAGRRPPGEPPGRPDGGERVSRKERQPRCDSR